MPLSWNEIKSRSLAFSKKWADAANEDSQAKPFLFALYQQLTSLLPPQKPKGRPRDKSAEIVD